jgi:surfactin synthase thioesterase subunit
MRNLDYPIWQQRYEAALVELDPLKIPGRLRAAQEAILTRQQELSGNSDGEIERMAINNAIRALRVLQIDNTRNLAASWKPKSRGPS